MSASTAARWLVAAVALAAITVALWQLRSLRDGLVVGSADVDGTPVTVWRSANTQAKVPVVVIAHGFAGSQQLMQPFATTLARNGYVAVTFDFPGHGRNPAPLSGGLADTQAMQHDLLDTLSSVSRFATQLPASDGRLAVLGHSMAADIVVRYADANPAVAATVAVSLFLPTQADLHPRNLLIVDGALEPELLRAQARTIIGASVDAPSVRDGVTYGDADSGTARRFAYARGVEHIGVLYSADSMHEALAWLNGVFHHEGDGFVDARGAWLGILLLGLVGLAWPASFLLPRLAQPDRRAAAWPAFVCVAAIPAVLTPLLLWRAPTSFLPILLGDYITLHFGVYGLLTCAGMWIAQWRAQRGVTFEPAAGRLAFVLAIAAVGAYSLLAIGASIDAFVFSFMPGSWRLPLIAVVFIGTLLYFLADERLTRVVAPVRGAYVLSKVFFLISLVIAVALNLEKLFFLVIIIPAILLLFVIYGIFSAWVFRQTRNPFVAAIANAIVFAWFIGVTFPIVSR
jgi:dienelactone hydrolase